MSALECKQPKPCIPNEQPREIYPPPTEKFSQCVGNYTWTWDGTRLTREKTQNIIDGTYSTLKIVDGCIVEYGYCPEPLYSPPYCAPLPAPCQDGGTGGSVTVSAAYGNQLVSTVGGLYSRAYVQGAGGTVVTGTGTAADPYIITSTAQTSTGGVIVGRDGIQITSDANGVNYAELSDTGATAGVYGNITVDKKGRITDISDPEDSRIQAGAGLKIETPPTGGRVIGHETRLFEDKNPTLGAYDITLDDTGHITSATRSINLKPAAYTLGVYNVSINAYGSITAIEQRADVMPAAGTFTVADGRTFSYDVAGRLTGVTGGTPSANPACRIRCRL